MTLAPIPVEEIVQFLVELLRAPSPTGDTDQAMATIERPVGGRIPAERVKRR